MKLGARFDRANKLEELEKIREEMDGMDLESLLSDKYKLVKTILIANGYEDEWDVEFWDTKVSPSDIDEFISKCAVKDYDPSSKKKAGLISN